MNELLRIRARRGYIDGVDRGNFLPQIRQSYEFHAASGYRTWVDDFPFLFCFQVSDRNGWKPVIIKENSRTNGGTPALVLRWQLENILQFRQRTESNEASQADAYPKLFILLGIALDGESGS